MFSSVAETYLKRFCGRFLRKFDAEHVSMGVTSLKLHNCEVKVEELQSIYLPYEARRIFVGEVVADLSFIFGGKFDITVKDIFIVIGRRHFDVNHFNAADIISMLQALITVFYFSYEDPESQHSSGITGKRRSLTKNEVEAFQRVADRIVVRIERAHLRVEESFFTHIPSPISTPSQCNGSDSEHQTQSKQLLCSGLIIDRIDLRPLNHVDRERHPELKLTSTRNNDSFSSPASTSSRKGTSSSSNTNSNKNLSHVLTKALLIEGLSAYCAREESAMPADEEVLMTIEEVRAQYYVRRRTGWMDADVQLDTASKQGSTPANDRNKYGCMLPPYNCSLFLSVGYNKTTQVLGPAICKLQADQLDLYFTDEQLLYLHHVINIIVENATRLKCLGRLSLTRPLPSDRSIRARMRWNLIRQSVMVDWWRYARRLSEGAMRWRCWFQMWRVAARYVALREILMYHIGYELTKDGIGSINISIKESLMINFRSNQQRGKRPRYQGAACFSSTVMSAAETIARQQLQYNCSFPNRYRKKQQQQEETLDDETLEENETSLQPINPNELSPIAVRALHALQLELDAMLPVKCSAFCRRYAEEKYKLRREWKRKERRERLAKIAQNKATLGAVPATVNNNSSSGVNTQMFYSLLVAPIDAINLRASFGASTVKSFITLRTDSWYNSESLCTTATANAKVPESKKASAFVQFKDIFSMPVDRDMLQQMHTSPVGTDAEATSLAGQNKAFINASIAVDCSDRGIFTMSMGQTKVSTLSLIRGSLQKALSLLHTDGKVKDTQESQIDFIGDVEVNDVQLSTEKNLITSSSASSDYTPPEISGMATKSNANESDRNVAVRFLTMLIIGNDDTHHAGQMKFEEAVQQAISERRTVLIRQKRRAAHDTVISSSIDDGEEVEDDQNFVLDPNNFTVQEAKCIVRVPKVTVHVSAVYAANQQVREHVMSALKKKESSAAQSSAQNLSTRGSARYSAALEPGDDEVEEEANILLSDRSSIAIPIVKVEMTSLLASATASNNPWIMHASAEVDSFELELYKHRTLEILNDDELARKYLNDEDNLDENSRLLAGIINPNSYETKKLLSLPYISITGRLYQTSTMSRFIESNTFDWACFDYTADFNMPPFKVAINPMELGGSNAFASKFNAFNCNIDGEPEVTFNSRSSNASDVNMTPGIAQLWRRRDSLGHLWSSLAGWAKGSNPMSIAMNGKHPPRILPEAAVRFGDIYRAHQQHLNVVAELWAMSDTEKLLLPNIDSSTDVPGNSTPLTQQSRKSQNLFTAGFASLTGSPQTKKESKVVTPTRSTNLPLPMQRSVIKCVAPMRALDVHLSVAPDPRTVFPALFNRGILGSRQFEGRNSVDSCAVVTATSSLSLFSDWFSASSSSRKEQPKGNELIHTAVAGQLEEEQLQHKNDDFVVNNRVHGVDVLEEGSEMVQLLKEQLVMTKQQQTKDRAEWEAQKQKLLQKIRALEERAMILESRLRKKKTT